MSKKTVKTQTETPVAAAPAPVTITLTDKVAKLGGTRKVWYDAIKGFQGRTLAEFLASDLPALPPKGSVKGRVRFLVREGYVILS